MRKEIVELAYAEALDVLRKCSTKDGFFAAFPGYDMVFARDSMIISLGASLVDKKTKETFRRSLITLAKNQSARGQIPNAVDAFSKRKKHVDFKSIDSTLWFLIGECVYRERYREKSLFNSHKKNVEKALNWLSYQDMGEDGMLEQLPTTDWQDAFPHRYGHTINTQALYYHVLNLFGKKDLAEFLRKKVNEDQEDGLWNGEFYLPWRWKNHNRFHEKGEWFDSLGNLLAIVFGLADRGRAAKILSYIERNEIDRPFPVKTIYPSIHRGSKDWQDYFDDCDARDPHRYLNGGIWTFIGGFYVLALMKMKNFKEAEHQLWKLAEANLQQPKFSEWLHGLSGAPGRSSAEGNDGNQGWNAGMYVLAYESLKAKKLFI